MPEEPKFLVFFPFVCLILFIIPKKWQHIWLLISSYFFYMCWNVKYSLLLFFVTIVTFFCGKIINKTESVKYKKITVAVGFVVCLAVLFLFKYVNFFGNIGNIALSYIGTDFRIRRFDFVLPVGISFYTFQALSYLVDVYRGDVEEEKDFVRFALFVSFFPQLVAGPIERSKNLLKQVNEPHGFDYDNMRKGLLLMVWGFFLKIVIADRAALFVDDVYSNADNILYGGEYMIIAAILFSIQIYCDFAGYSIIAIGVAKVMGINLMENFNTPYLAQSVEGFWRKWHISLTSWFRDYLYIPLGGNRKGRLRKYLNIFIVFLTSGLWHGAGGHFVIWGGLNGIFQIIGDMTSQVRNRLCVLLHINKKNSLLAVCKTVITFFMITGTWIFFRADSLRTAIIVIRKIISVRGFSSDVWKNVFTSILSGKQFVVLVASIIVLFSADIMKKRNINIIEYIINRNIAVRWLIYFIAVFSIIIFGVWGPKYLANNFIYFQF